MGHYIYKSIPDAKFEVDSSFSFEDMTSQNFPQNWREQVIQFDYLPPENGFNFKKTNFYVQNRSSRPKIDPPYQFQQLSSRGNFFHFQNFWDVSMMKEQQQPPWLINFAKIWSECALRTN